MRKILTVLIGALALATMGLGSPELAATPSFGGQSVEASTLTITLPETNPHNDVPGPRRNGYRVEVGRVNGVDITTKDGYNRALGLKVDDVDELGTAFVASAVTDNTGSVAFTGLEPALYLVETTAPDGRVIAMDISPVLVALPSVDDRGEWTYSVALMLKQQPPKPPVPPENIPNPSPSPSPTPPPSGSTPNLPHTGLAVLGLIGLAALLIVVGGTTLTQARSER